MLTFQDFEKAQNEGNVVEFIQKAINSHKSSTLFKVAIDADNYDKQRNTTVMEYVRFMYNSTGAKVPDLTVSNNKLCSNFFHRLNTQRCTYSLGNGVSFSNHKIKIPQEDGTEVTIDQTKEKLGQRFDTDLKNAAYYALIHGVSFGFWDYDRLKVFKITEFVPFWDEETSELRAGIRFWQIDDDKPLIAVLYEKDGYSVYKKPKGDTLHPDGDKQKYITTYVGTAEGGVEEITYSNYNEDGFPIVPLWGSPLHQSTLIGMRGQIDAFDLIKSGFANDLDDCAEIYWLISGADGMSEADLSKFRRKLKLDHVVSSGEDQAIQPFTQEIPYQARKTFTDDIRNQIYEDFGGLDVHTIAAGATNDHIDAAYQPMDEEADNFELQVIEFIQNILELIGIEDTPIFKRNRISNQMEQTQMVLSASDYLDEETVLQKLPFISTDEVSGILARKDLENESRFGEEEPLEGEEEEPLE